MRPDLRIPGDDRLMHTRRLPAHMTNYVILAPPSTHFRPATCEEVQCRAFTIGWENHLDEAVPALKELADWIRSGVHGNRFEEWRAPGSSITTFRFGPHQNPRKFSPKHREHKVKIERPEWFGVRNADTGWDLKLHAGAENGARDWVDDFATNQDLAARKRQRG